jgi:hypothetical protein
MNTASRRSQRKWRAHTRISTAQSPAVVASGLLREATRSRSRSRYNLMTRSKVPLTLSQCSAKTLLALDGYHQAPERFRRTWADYLIGTFNGAAAGSTHTHLFAAFTYPVILMRYIGAQFPLGMRLAALAPLGFITHWNHGAAV